MGKVAETIETGYLRTGPAAKYLGLRQSTLERARLEGWGPPFRRLGAKIVAYSISDLDAWAGQAINGPQKGRL